MQFYTQLFKDLSSMLSVKSEVCNSKDTVLIFLIKTKRFGSSSKYRFSIFKVNDHGAIGFKVDYWRHQIFVFFQAAWKVWASDLSKNYKATWMPHTKVVKSFADSELQALFSCPADSFVNLPGTSLRCEYSALYNRMSLKSTLSKKSPNFSDLFANDPNTRKMIRLFVFVIQRI